MPPTNPTQTQHRNTIHKRIKINVTAYWLPVSNKYLLPLSSASLSLVHTYATTCYESNIVTILLFKMHDAYLHIYIPTVDRIWFIITVVGARDEK